MNLSRISRSIRHVSDGLWSVLVSTKPRKAAKQWKRKCHEQLHQQV